MKEGAESVQGVTASLFQVTRSRKFQSCWNNS